MSSRDDSTTAGAQSSAFRLSRPLSDALVDLMAERFAAFAQPLRIRLIDVLESRGEATVQELAEALGAGQQNVSKHLLVLRRAGIVARRRHGTTARYRLAEPDALAQLEGAALGIARRLRRQSRLLPHDPQ